VRTCRTNTAESWTLTVSYSSYSTLPASSYEPTVTINRVCPVPSQKWSRLRSKPNIVWKVVDCAHSHALGSRSCQGLGFGKQNGNLRNLSSNQFPSPCTIHNQPLHVGVPHHGDDQRYR
jgi:hypothetical protein